MTKQAKIFDAVKLIEDFAPLHLQGSFDNCGLNIGEADEPLNGILITLDTNENVVAEAIENGCNLIVEHHPILFDAVKKIGNILPKDKTLRLALKHDIAIYSAHTNVDFTENGLNDFLASQLGGDDVHCLSGCDSARLAVLKTPMSAEQFLNKVKLILNDENATLVGDKDRLITSFACINGSGGGSEQTLLDVISHKADIFLTSELKYKVLRLAKDLNYAIISYGHYESEIGFLNLMYDKLSVLKGVKVLKSKTNKSPFHR